MVVVGDTVSKVAKKIPRLTVCLLWGTVDTKIKVPSSKKPELSDVRSIKPGMYQDIAVLALTTARNFSHSHFYLPGLFTFIF